jgi:hypothetical protein
MSKHGFTIGFTLNRKHDFVNEDIPRQDAIAEKS